MLDMTRACEEMDGFFWMGSKDELARAGNNDEE